MKPRTKLFLIALGVVVIAVLLAVIVLVTRFQPEPEPSPAPQDFRLLTENISEDEVRITGYEGQPTDGTLTIPEKIAEDGAEKTVAAIADGAFEGCIDEASGISRVVIPASVLQIGENAFSNNDGLAEVAFAEDSHLTYIGASAFENSSKLTAFAFPEQLREIGNFAFSGCESWSGSVALPASLTDFGFGVFEGCGISAFLAAQGSTAFRSTDGVLYDSTQTNLIAYPAQRDAAVFSVPAGVATIEARAFEGCSALECVELGEVTSIGDRAFADCDNLASVSSEHAEYVGRDAFAGTGWLELAGEKVVLGKTLYAYRGTDAHLDLSGLYSVSPYAAYGNQSLQSVTVDNAMRTIDNCAFLDCEQLAAVWLNNLNNIVYIGTDTWGGTAEDLTIYVPQRIQSAYEENALWKPYLDNIALHVTAVEFIFNGGSLDGETSFRGEVAYGGYLSLPEPKLAGYHLLGWYASEDLSGEPWPEGMLWTGFQSSVRLYAKWEKLG